MHMAQFEKKWEERYRGWPRRVAPDVYQRKDMQSADPQSGTQTSVRAGAQPRAVSRTRGYLMPLSFLFLMKCQ